jgi:hypothetical protein
MSSNADVQLNDCDIFWSSYIAVGGIGSVVGWGTMLQAW